MGKINSKNLYPNTFTERSLPAIVENPNKIIKIYRVEVLLTQVSPLYAVYKCTHLKTGQTYILRKHTFGPRGENSLLYELDLYRQINHPCTIKILEYFKTDACIFVINELFEGKNISEYILNAVKFEEQDVVEIIKQLLNFVNYLHMKQIINRNLTLSNLMYSGKTIKVINFNRAIKFKHGQRFSNKVSGVYYRSPEMINGKYNSKVDVWAIGIITYMLLTGRPPFNGTSDREIETEILQKEIDREMIRNYDISDDAFDFLKKILIKSKTKRPKTDELLKHPWITSKMYRASNVKLNNTVIRNLKAFTFKDKFQKAIYAFLVSRMATENDKALALREFQKLDTDNNGVLSKNEILDGLKRLSVHVRENDAEIIFKRLDRKKQGVVEYNEFLEAFIDREDFLREDHLSECFDLLDENKTGVLTIRDFEKVFGSSIDNDYVVNKFAKYARGLYIDKKKFVEMLRDICQGNADFVQKKI